LRLRRRWEDNIKIDLKADVSLWGGFILFSVGTIDELFWARLCCFCTVIFFPMVRQPLGGLGLLIIKASRSNSDTPHSVGLLWTSDQPVAETSTWHHTTLTRDRHPCPRRDSNPQSQ
jgi:hypothetical protein